jgi:hypothetical protein
MKTSFLVASALVLAGCVSVRPTYLADGSQGHAISCNGARLNMGDCIEKAGEICGSSGYTIVDERGSISPFYAASGGFKSDQKTSGGGYTAIAGASASRSMFVKCGKM